MSNNGLLVVISGFSGAGKNTLVESLYKKYSSNYVDSVSVTTRIKREDEIDGVSYYFKTKEKFEQMLLEGELLEWTTYAGEYYGTPKEPVLNNLKQGKTVVFILNTIGARYLKDKYNAVLVFVTTPSIINLKERLISRNTETLEQIDKRLAEIPNEVEDISYYDYLIVNDDIDKCTDLLHNIIEVEKYNIYNQKDIINKMKEDLGMEVKEEKFR